MPDPPIYTVHALRLGTLTVDRGGMIYGFPRGELIDIPVWSAAIEGGGHRVLVDTGLADPRRWSAYNPCLQRADETLAAALAELGWKHADIDIVVNTHLHYDHCENNPFLPRAQFFVSELEWVHAHRPVPSQAWSYQAPWTGPEVTERNYTRIRADSYDVLPGLRMISTPGHTPGHQSVLVDTADGVLCVAGDAACLMENLAVPTPPAVNVSVEESLRSIEKIRTLAQRILMNHDPNIAKFQSSTFPMMPARGGYDTRTVPETAVAEGAA
jgi:N-acyl homoserine lactone hydrolase